MDIYSSIPQPHMTNPETTIHGSAVPRLVVGMGTIDDYIPLVEAGADEIFCGYIPAAWSETFGDLAPMNRREVLYTNVQIGSFSELEILKEMVKDHHVPVTLTLNRTAYDPAMLPFLKNYMTQCSALGFNHFIVADPALLQKASEMKDFENACTPQQNHDTELNCTPEKLFHTNDRMAVYFPQAAPLFFHLSGEYGELNHLILKELSAQYAPSLKRIIFPRQTTLWEMEQMIRFMNRAGFHLEYEAFVFNEKCHFTGAYCNSMHSDFFSHMCLVPYQLALKDKNGKWTPAETRIVFEDNAEDFVTDMSENTIERTNEAYVCSTSDASVETSTEAVHACPGSTGCGLCAIYRLWSMGVTHLKVVSRGNYSENTLSDVRLLRSALTILRQSETEAEYIHSMKHALFPHGCSKNCYYDETRSWS